MSVQIDRLVFALFLVLASLHEGQATSDPLYLYRNGLELERSPLYRMLFVAQPEQRLAPAKRDKKYDRNCFFSPVQCMLSYNTNNNDALYHPHGRNVATHPTSSKVHTVRNVKQSDPNVMRGALIRSFERESDLSSNGTP